MATVSRLSDYAGLKLTALQATAPTVFAQVEPLVQAQAADEITSALGAASAALRAAVLAVLWQGGAYASLQAVRAALAKSSPALAKEASNFPHQLERLRLNVQGLKASKLSDIPALMPSIDHAQLSAVGELAGLSRDKLVKLLGAVPRVTAVDDDAIAALVADKTLSDGEAKTLGQVTTLYNVLDGSEPMVTAARAHLTSGDVRDLASLSSADWSALLTSAKITPPRGLTMEAYSAQTGTRMAALFPTRGLLGFLVPKDVGAQLRSFKDADARTRFINRYPGLGLDALMGDGSFSETRLAQIEQRLALLTKVVQQNPATELLKLDYSFDSKASSRLNLSGLSADEQQMVLSTFKAYQRTWVLTQDRAATTALLEAGYTAATAIMADSLTVFGAKTGFSAAQAKRYYTAAQFSSTTVSMRASAITDIIKNGFGNVAVANDNPDISDYLKQIPGFAQLFGSQAMCACSDCESLLSPAAYFVDLMCWVKKNVTSVYFTGAHASHPLNLKVRRPDLWTLELSCDNTNTLIATLQIVDEVLENFVAQQHQYGGSLTDRTAVETFVYSKTLTGTPHSFRQPFSLPSLRLATYLGYFQQKRATIAQTVDAPEPAREAARLGISAAERALIIGADATLATQQRLYNIQFTQSGSEIAAVQAKTLYGAMDLTREQLGDLAATRFVHVGAPALAITMEKKSNQSVQNDVERVHHLTLDGLDRMHRMTRLQRCLPWTIGELDLVLTQLGDTTLASLQPLTDLLAIQDQVSCSVEDLCALTGTLPQLPITIDGTSLFDRAFNLPFYVAAGGAFPADNTRFVHPSFRSAPPAASDTTPARLTGALRVSDEDLIRLITALAQPLGADLQASDENQRGFFLTVANLSLLYRHARLAEQLALSVAALFQLITLAGLAPAVTNAAQLATLDAFNIWWRSTSYSLDDLGYVTGGQVQLPSTYLDPDLSAANLIDAIAADKALLFADTAFAFFKGVTEDQSRAIVAANVAGPSNPTPLFALAPDGTNYWLSVNFSPSSLPIIPAGTPVAAADVRDLLLQRHAVRILPSRLASLLSLSADQVSGLLSMAGADLSTSFTRVLQGVDPPTALAELLRRLLRLWVLLRDPAFDADALAFVQAQAARFAIADFANVTMDSVRKLSIYAALCATSSAVYTNAATPLDPADVRAVMSAFDPVQAFAAADSAQLARVVRAQPGLVSTVIPTLTLPNTAPEALDKLARAVALVQALGVSGDFLAHAVSDVYADLQAAADAVLSATRARFDDESEWETAIDPFNDTVLAGQRDALVDHMIRSLSPGFADADAIYDYFLIDVSAGGCSDTSRVVSAISSVQLYVNRILMNLEADALAAADPGHVAVLPTAIPADEWTWRQNYRVWEANRVVFLYPESYIEPELRDDKTPIFEELESDLLQTAVDDQSVLDAYSSYLSTFDEIAQLKITGVWHDIKTDNPTSDILHMIGMTPGDPPQYYYRTAENLYFGEIDGKSGVVWTPWQAISVQITSDCATPVVFNNRLYVFWSAYKTKSRNIVAGGGSQFDGYSHNMTIAYTQLRLDGTWSALQELTMPADPSGYPFGPSAGQVLDRLEDAEPHPDGGIPEYSYPQQSQTDPLDDYTLSGVNWDRLYLDPNDDNLAGDLSIVGRDYQLYGYVNLYPRDITYRWRDRRGLSDWGSSPILCARTDGSNSNTVRRLYSGAVKWWKPNRISFADLVLDESTFKRWEEYSPIPMSTPAPSYTRRLADIGDISLMTVAGALKVAGQDALLQRPSNGDALLLQGSVRSGNGFVIRRLGCTIADGLGQKLFTDGVAGMLDIQYQLKLKEHPLPIDIYQSRIEDQTNKGKLDYTGPYGVYYREIFFQIPFLIANYLNSQGQYESAQKWYRYIFDPTAADVTNPPLDRNWRYREFRHLDVPSLLEILTDQAQIDVYRTDPFNPHAIARLRLSAYQKCIVMKYVDNLLDWGDSLFTQFTTESVNEAIMLYVMAKQILGPRPEELGDCGDAVTTPKTYAQLEPMCSTASEFLVEVESFVVGKQVARQPNLTWTYTLAPTDIDWEIAANLPAPSSGDPQGIFRANWGETRAGNWSRRSKSGNAVARLKQSNHSPIISEAEAAPEFSWSVMQQVASAFCVPPNEDLMAYWDRVDDRLFKIRNCMDIDGNLRQLALFAPYIDPALLVRMKAAGLSLDDVLSSISGDLPPYRFLFLIEKAKATASTLQGYGAALLSALEKKDNEELAQMRTVHQQNLLKLTTKMRQDEIDVAQKAIDETQAQIDASTFRRDHYQSLLDSGLIGPETSQQGAKNDATTALTGATIVETMAATFYPTPQIGSPFSMKYGGKELGDTMRAWGTLGRSYAAVSDSQSSASAIEAGFERRTEEWTYQRDQSNKDLTVLNKKLDAAQIRLDMANRAMTVHQTSIDQTEQVYEYFLDKFSNMGLYTYLSMSLQTLFRNAYNGAYAMAKLAEQAYRFERNDDDTPLLQPSYWDSAHNGLLAGEQLLVDLQSMEKQFLSTNYRTLEMDQPFSLLQIAPAALVQLRETGTCDFWIPEVYFDLFYPGQYLRRIKSVRLTIPSVTGPYTNVSATLTLVESQIRTQPKLDAASLAQVPPRRSVSIATSTAQNDAGVFELSFRDERYMPFEGAGTISHWSLSLPQAFKPFDYQTINDVIVSIAYTASYDGAFRGQVETQNAATTGALVNVLGKGPLMRMFSLRSDFASAFNRLLHSPAGVSVPFEVTDKYFPLFLTGRQITVTKAKLIARVAAGTNLGAFTIAIDGKPQTGLLPDSTLGNLPARDLGPLFAAGIVGAHTLAISNAGGLAPSSPPPGDVSAVDAAKLGDLYLYLEYHI